MCIAWARLGYSVSLIVPKTIHNEDSALRAEYWEILELSGVRILSIECLDCYWLKRINERAWYLMRLLSFALHSATLLAAGRLSPKDVKRNELVYSRDAIFLFLCRILNPLIGNRSVFCLEAHYEISNCRWLIGQNIPIICISKSLATFFSNHINSKNIFFEHDGVFVDQWRSQRCRSSKRKIHKRRRLMLYAGSAHKWKGVGVLVDCLKYLPDDYILVLVGLKTEDISLTIDDLKLLSRVEFYGYLNQKRLRRFYSIADYHIVPSLSQDRFGKHTSPLKLFEYMAVGGRIFASDIPSISEVIQSGKNGILFETGNAVDLADKILNTSENILNSISEQAAVDALHYDWRNRASRIIGKVTLNSEGKVI
jgi:glycosyltransferase involved in cell wall biosynthesis